MISVKDNLSLTFAYTTDYTNRLHELQRLPSCMNEMNLSVGIADEDFPLQGVGLLGLPEEILQNIAGHFTLKEWTQGPALVCRLFHELDLRKIELNCFKAQSVSPHKILHHVPFCVCKCVCHD